MSVSQPVSAAFRFRPEVSRELARKSQELGISRTEFLTRCIMEGSAPSTLEERVAELERRLDALELERTAVALIERGHP